MAIITRNPQPAESASFREAPVFDDDAVAAMEAIAGRSGRDVVGKVWKLFRAQAPEAVSKLEALAGDANLAGASKQAHFLKSMSLSAGATRLAALCEASGHEARSGNSGALVGNASIRPL